MQSTFPKKQNQATIPKGGASSGDMSRWIIYILRCADNTLYTGVTTDVERRLKEHNSTAAGARYTKTRRPVQLVYAENAANRSDACRREYQIKQLNRTAKENLIASLQY